MNNNNRLIKFVLERAKREMGFEFDSEAGNYMMGYMSGLMSHMERAVPGVAEELERELQRQQNRRP